MKGDPRVITALNARLVEEATGINQYSANIGLLRNWQFNKLADYVAERRADEQRHYDMVQDQILFLDGVPVSGLLNPVHPGTNVPEMLIFDHATEQKSIDGYNSTITLCLEVEDEITANILRSIIKDEADHINDIEARQMQISQTGLGQFLAVQIGG
ncbi:MAG: ferritin-like domain-containing protein [Oryzomonas sp.]|jgi:bacterioferritin